MVSEKTPAVEEKTAELPAGTQGGPVEAQSSPEDKAAGTAAAPSAGTGRLSRLKDHWPGLLQDIKRRQKSTAAWLEPSVVEDCRGELVCLAYGPEYAIHQERIMSDAHRGLVEEVLSAFLQEQVRIKAVISEGSTGVKGRPAGGSVLNQGENPAGAVKKKIVLRAEEAKKIFGGKIIETD